MQRKKLSVKDCITSAQEAFKNQKYEVAIIHCEYALSKIEAEKEPISAEDLNVFDFLYAKALVQNKNYEAAILQLSKKKKKNASKVEAYVLRADAYEANDDYEKATADRLKCVEFAPEISNLHVLLGRTHAANNNIYSAQKSYTQAIKLDPNNKFAYQKRAKLYIDAAEYEKASNDLKQLKENDEYWDLNAWLLEAKIHEYYAEFTKAEECYKKALKGCINPAATLLLLAKNLCRQNKLSEAETCCLSIVAHNSEVSGRDEEDIETEEAVNLLIKIYAEMKQYANAIRYCFKKLSYNCHIAETKDKMGLFFCYESRLDLAVYYYISAWMINPKKCVYAKTMLPKESKRIVFTEIMRMPSQEKKIMLLEACLRNDKPLHDLMFSRGMFELQTDYNQFIDNIRSHLTKLKPGSVIPFSVIGENNRLNTQNDDDNDYELTTLSKW